MARKNVRQVFDSLIAQEEFTLPTLCTHSNAIFSYAMPIAKLKFNRTIEIVNKDESPSVTTTGHINGIIELAESNDFTIERVRKIS